MGESYEIKRKYPCDEIPIATFCPDPEPHTFFGLSITDVLADVQRIKSSILRNSLDSLAMSIHPRVGVVDGAVNISDVLNTEVGSVVRMTQPGAVQPFAMPFVGQPAMEMLQYMDRLKESHTGISAAARGLDADA